MTEIERDLLATLAGAAVVDACGGGKRIASAAGVDESNGWRWARGERSNPVYRVRAMLEKAADPFAIVAYLAACACRALLAKPLPEWRWRTLYVEACHVEQPHDGHEDVVTVGLLTGKSSLADQLEADQRVISATMRRLALGFVGMQRGYTLAGPRGN